MTATPAIEGWFTTGVPASGVPASGEPPALLGSRCTTCSTVYFPPVAGFCRNPSCDSEGFEVAELGRRGTVWSYTDAQYQPPAPYIPRGDATTPDFEYVPFALAAVELPEGLVVLGQVADGFGVADLLVGAEVELVVEELCPGELIWRWKPVQAGGAA